MHTLTATYRIVTPMFLGDADQKATGIRPPSVKGALRFWWRALNWGRFREDADDASALRKLHAAEAELFGAAAEENKHSGQARFILRTEYAPDTHKQEFAWSQSSGIQYLLGQGLWHFRDRLLRSFLAPGTLKLEMCLKEISDEQCLQLQQALLALGLFGGLGSRSRRGLGSLAIQDIRDSLSDCVWIPKSPADLKKIPECFALKSIDTLPPFSAFSRHSRLDISQQGNNSFHLLNAVGEEFQLYRSWGKADRQGIHKVGGREAEQKFPEDHNWARQAVDGIKPPYLPKRSIFGFPHNYFFSSDNRKVDIAPGAEGRGRRASPLFIHAHFFPDGTHAVLQLLLPALFLPEHDRVELKSRKSFQLNVPAVDWKVIHNYMNRFKQREEVIHAEG